MRKINYRQQKKTREEARKVRKTEKEGRRQAPVATSTDVDATQSQVSKTPEAS